MMSDAIVTTILSTLFVSHAWLVFGHRQKMGADPKDKPQDPLYSPLGEKIAFGLMSLIQALAIYRRLHLQGGDWIPILWYDRFLDFLPLPSNDATLCIGAAIYALGFLLRVVSIRLLGRLFTFEIGIRPEHKIIEDGPYRFVRHPSYTGYLVLLLGFGIAVGSAFALLGMLLGAFVFLWLRMNQEETMLQKHFGDAYLKYMRRTKRLIPFIY